MCTVLLTVASTVIGAAGQLYSGMAQARAANYQAKVAEMNARIERKRAVDAIDRGHEEERKHRMEVAQLQGEQEASYAASGLDLSYGSPNAVIASTATLGELDAQTIRSNARKESYDRLVGAANQDAEAQMKKAEARSAKVGAFFGAAGTLVGGAADAWGQMKPASSIGGGSGSSLTSPSAGRSKLKYRPTYNYGSV